MAVRVVVGRPFKNEEGRHYDKTFATALTGEGKTYNRAYGARKCTPSAYGTSPGGGGFSGTML